MARIVVVNPGRNYPCLRNPRISESRLRETPLTAFMPLIMRKRLNGFFASILICGRNTKMLSS